MRIEKSIAIVDDILARWKDAMDNDALGYTNHVYRVIHFALALSQNPERDRDYVYISAPFHDIVIQFINRIQYSNIATEIEA